MVMRRNDARDLKLSHVHVFTAMRRNEIAAAEDAVKAAKKSLEDDGQGPLLLEVDLLLWQNLAEKQDRLIKLLTASAEEDLSK